MARHVHADVIHAWAEGEEIEFRNMDMEDWRSTKHANLVWFEMTEYRVKPKVVKKEGWVNVYKSTFHEAMLSDAFPNKESADRNSSLDRLACLRIEWEEPVAESATTEPVVSSKMERPFVRLTDVEI